MAKFGEVLSTTAKVILALALISLVVGIGIGFLGMLASSVPTNPPGGAAPSEGDKYDEVADAVRTSMPQSQWDRGMRRTVKRRCFITGMNKDEVVRALGEPSERKEYSAGNGSTWTWELAPGKCLRYDGDACVERKPNNRIIFFSPKGSVKLESGACYTLGGDYVMSADELFSEKALPGEPAARAISQVKGTLAEMEAESGLWHTQAYCEKNGYYWRDGDCHTSPDASQAQAPQSK